MKTFKKIDILMIKFFLKIKVNGILVLN